jgi:DNA-binding MarR family transcriptional regulator
MSQDFQKNLRIRRPSAATSLPPALVEETGWDILLALHSDRRCELSLDKLAALVSVPQAVMSRWLPGLEQRRLITETADSPTGEVRAVLTSVGRELLERYLTATTDLQVGANL